VHLANCSHVGWQDFCFESGVLHGATVQGRTSLCNGLRTTITIELKKDIYRSGSHCVSDENLGSEAPELCLTLCYL